ncbi:winged helix-turn-helix domain-containing protein [Streptomyces sp. A0592]|uniref:winged helix-turn-helix domain-containing protein n=1 Tax=Streptomyces sp. A0592 TaxID=2563099 RepID=UPI00109E6B38|nr:winged helix-turn-helix domain-containing protein [Streptomyces sp. A0592]THA79791.1 ArsR family transcriptional regulator [Streptomyces sp. A0592]
MGSGWSCCCWSTAWPPGATGGATARAETWARAAGISFRTDGTASAAVSRHLARLRELGLVDTAPDGRHTRIFKLFEDGSGTPYTAPPGKADGSRRDVYFKVPFEYWEQGFHESLSVPAKVMLLIFMSMRSRSFVLRQDKKFASWYGISPSTAGRGIRELQEMELVYPFLAEQHLDGFAVLGQSTRERWALAAPFDLNINKTDREAADSVWTVEGVACTAARFVAILPTPSAAPGAAPAAAGAAR